ncbi:hypothetical protein MINS_32510 [Mycolicibacterium insubricum]|jgi:hypothetical protein|nr:hypothetical protein [Mycolicibacterium insubricum]MCV7082032.1 hypothetical protein [Mycolicibacterium insubricum]BBZ67822.1 hypothetical protein MINS_32510 [Mycolicibacterium insubricum]
MPGVEVPAETPAPETTEPAAPAALADSFAGLDLPGGQVGIAVTDGTTTLTFGDWTRGPAWSTIKVPLSIAAVRHAQQSQSDAPGADIASAITQSDNAAADRLWNGLGGGEQAAQAVQQVLADAGDSETVVQPWQVRPPFSPFGQTDWPLSQAARLAFELPCLAGSESVLTQMRQLGGNQQWGLAVDDGVAAKGGWGPDTSGGYLVRQVALIPSGEATIGVAMAAYPANGSFDTGTSMLTALGRWLDEHRAELPAGTCKPR